VAASLPLRLAVAGDEALMRHGADQRACVWAALVWRGAWLWCRTLCV
jgi:hypothetical protein